MNRRRIAIGAAVALAATGAGVAYGATSGGEPQQELLNDAAQRLNVRPGELRAALQGAFEDQLDEAVRDGKLTQRQADRIKQQIERHGLPLGGPGIGPGPGGPGFHISGGPPGLDAAADYLGLTRAQLGRRLANGKSLAQIARAEGKSVDGLEDAIVAAAQADLDRAVADGDLTQAQADEMLRGLQEHVDELVAGKGPRGGPRMHHGFGPGGPPPMFRDERGGQRSGNEPGSFTAPAPPAGAWS